MSDGYVGEHRKVAWDAGLLTDPKLHVHHKDEDKQNNSIDNLEVKANSQHAKEHIHERGYIDNQHGRHPLQLPVCQIDGCDKPTESRGWCSAHYTRFLRLGDPLGSASKPRRRKTV